MRYMPNWVIETWELSGKEQLGDVGVLLDGEFASVVSMNCILTKSDHKRLRELEKEHRKEDAAYYNKYRVRPFFGKTDKDLREWTEMCERHRRDWESVYSRGEPYIDGHRFLVCAAPYAYELLKKYQETGTIDSNEVSRVISIMEGKDAPVIPREGND